MLRRRLQGRICNDAPSDVNNVCLRLADMKKRASKCDANLALHKVPYQSYASVLFFPRVSPCRGKWDYFGCLFVHLHFSSSQIRRLLRPAPCFWLTYAASPSITFQIQAYLRAQLGTVEGLSPGTTSMTYQMREGIRSSSYT